MKKGNSFITVDLHAISSNIKVLQSYQTPGAGQIAVVKADAYGHGAVKVAQHVASQVDWFAVNSVDEGIELRENNIKNPILVFGVPEHPFADLYKQYNLTATISDAVHFKELPAGTEYHLNFDTGMRRLGFRAEQLDAVLQLKKNHPALKCTGIYSHFATADEINSAKMHQQLQSFKPIRRPFPPEILAHLCNTAGVIQCEGASFDLIRTGIGVYGYAPGPLSVPELEPAISWQTHIVQLKAIKKGETVSYGAAWNAREDGFVGIIPVGYADGIPRRLSGNFNVSIGGKTYPVVGTVTMNYCMVYLEKKRVECGTCVFLLNRELTATEWANKTGTIPYEILTSIAPHVPRQYKIR